MATLTSRIRGVVDELSDIQGTLNRALLDGGDDNEAAPFRSLADADALRDLKSVVDQLRHFLWFYLQVVSSNSEAGERTLQVLRHATKSANAMAATSPLTFLERLNALTEYALVHYHEDTGGKPN